jgi:hypothetical protein
MSHRLPNVSDTFVGPCKLTCHLECEVPVGWELAPVPVPRHAWSDVLVCPNDGCELAFLVRELQPVRTDDQATA